MTDETWRPLGVDTDERVAEYDALHDGVPAWMESAYWAWVRVSLTVFETYRDGSGRVPMLRVLPAERMCQRLRIPLPNLRTPSVDLSTGKKQLSTAMSVLQQHAAPLQIADYLLAHGEATEPEALEGLLDRSKSAWTVGTRSGRPGLVRRVPEGVQTAADAVMQRPGQAGVRLARAWEELYGLDPNPSEAYRLAILAVEDAAVPEVSPANARATLGTVLAQMESQGDWSLPMDREHDNAPSRDVVVAMARMLWHGQHDRHGGQPSAPGNVSEAEARVAVSLAVALVDWFSAGLVSRSTT
ncbi:hypothetical protein EUA93_12655 [Nocardioides oleivorans]|uniref:TIGR02391 family protein n=1 Tax=Nocardioides oleivorans TaxID=273676 RepID=A0A4Q2S424_9ACTN|nr:hypothetical protein [Nocardioides oleivorans]RYB95119.1 hypothetical protein EUA93_12655 [Nocardioides oleivorans]